MPFLNLAPDLKVVFDDLSRRLRILETQTRFSAPIVATDPTNPRKGDIWINSTSNTAKIVDANGTVRTITWV